MSFFWILERTLPGRVVGHHLVIVIPEYVGRRLGTVGDNTGEVDHRTSVNVEVGRTLDPDMRD